MYMTFVSPIHGAFLIESFQPIANVQDYFALATFWEIILLKILQK